MDARTLSLGGKALRFTETTGGSARPRFRLDVDGTAVVLLVRGGDDDRANARILAECLSSEHTACREEDGRLVLERTISGLSGVSSTSKATIRFRSPSEVDAVVESIENEIDPHIGW
jgi:hypothetical protein